MTNKIILAILLIVTLSISGCSNIILSEEDAELSAEAQLLAVKGDFEMSILEIGQADAIIMRTENHNIMVDCGEKNDGDEIVEFLQNNDITNIDCLFITHFDKDHVGGFPKLAKSIPINKIYVPNYIGNNKEYEKYLNISKNLDTVTLTKDSTFTFDDVLFNVSVPKKSFYKEGDNDYSLVMSITHGDNKFLLAGDSEEERLNEVMIEFNESYDFLKVPHHGNSNKNTKKFLSIVKPKYAVITDSEKNPSEDETLKILKTLRSNVYCTKNGDIKICSNGTEIKIFQ